jgi:tripartite-type tricarboxylate transporter receptor subunit TctC
MSFMRATMRALCAAAILSSASVANSQSLTNKPIRIVTAEPGGGSDFTARQIARGISSSLGQNVVVENRPSGVIPGEVVSKATPNGHTLLVFTNILWIGPLLQKTPYDAMKDFSPVSGVASTPSVLVVPSSLPLKSVTELVDLARAKPGELNYGSTGTGSTNHLSAELFKSMARVNIVRVAYKGGSIALNGVIAGEVQMMFTTPLTGATHVKSGRLKVLGVTSAKPSALAPGVPTLSASGLPGYDLITQYGIFAPAKTPPAIIAKLNAEVVSFLNAAETKERFFNAGLEANGSTPQELVAFMKADVAKVGKLIKDAGIRVE